MEKEFVQSEDGKKYEMIADPMPFRISRKEDAELLAAKNFCLDDFPMEKLPGASGYEEAAYEIRYLIMGRK